MNLSEWAARVGVSKFTAYRWFREGRLPVPAQRVGRLILVDVPAAGAPSEGRTVIYARVAGREQQEDLDRQVARLTQWATAQGLSVDEVVAEVGSGVTGRRPRLSRILSNPQAARIVVEHRDRLARFGVEHLEAALGAQGRSILVADEGERTDDLLREATDALAWFCGRLYGRRGARNRAEKALRCAKQDVGPSSL
jgi:putative resolvase